MYVDGRPKATRNIVGFINSAQPVETTKKLNCIFEAREGNHIFVYATKTIVPGEELLIDYNLNRIDGEGDRGKAPTSPQQVNVKYSKNL
jgi:SET domain-containing protein